MGNVVTFENGQKVVRPETPEDLASVQPAPDRAAMKLSRRQVIIGLTREGLITEAEALAWSTADALPLAIETLILSMPADQQTEARVTLMTFVEALRLDPMVAMLADAASKPPDGAALDDAALDAFFATYSQI